MKIYQTKPKNGPADIQKTHFMEYNLRYLYCNILFAVLPGGKISREHLFEEILW